MNWSVDTKRMLRAFCSLAIVFALNSTALPQHEGHVMPKPKAATPKAKRATPKKRTPRARRTTTRRVARPRPSPSPSPHVMAPGMQMPAASPSPTPHVMTPGMQMPTASPSPSPGHVMTPGMQMPTASPSPAQPPADIQRPRRQVIPAGPVMRLEDLEAMATQRNPTLACARA